MDTIAANCSGDSCPCRSMVVEEPIWMQPKKPPPMPSPPKTPPNQESGDSQPMKYVEPKPMGYESEKVGKVSPTAGKVKKPPTPKVTKEPVKVVTKEPVKAAKEPQPVKVVKESLPVKEVEPANAEDEPGPVQFVKAPQKSMKVSKTTQTEKSWERESYSPLPPVIKIPIYNKAYQRSSRDLLAYKEHQRRMAREPLPSKEPPKVKKSRKGKTGSKRESKGTARRSTSSNTPATRSRKTLKPKKSARNAPLEIGTSVSSPSIGASREGPENRATHGDQNRHDRSATALPKSGPHKALPERPKRKGKKAEWVKRLYPSAPQPPKLELHDELGNKGHVGNTPTKLPQIPHQATKKDAYNNFMRASTAFLNPKPVYFPADDDDDDDEDESVTDSSNSDSEGSSDYIEEGQGGITTKLPQINA